MIDNDFYPTGVAIREFVDPKRQQQLLNELFSGKSLIKQERARLLIEILGVHKANIKAVFYFIPPRNISIVVDRYMNGVIPFASIDKYGFNRRQLFKELLHDIVTESSFDNAIADKLHVEIDQVFPMNKPLTIFDNAFDTDAPQKFFSDRSFSEVVTDKRQGKVYLTDTELADYQTYLYDEIAEAAIESGQEKQAIALINKHADALEVTICDSGDCSLSSIEDYIDALEKSLIERVNKNYLDEFKPNKQAEKKR